MKQKLKGAMKSWTIWINSISAFLVLNIDFILANLPALKQAVTPQQFMMIIVVTNIVNILLRIKTNKPLDER